MTRRVRVARNIAACAALLVIYAVVPVSAEPVTGSLVLRWVATAAMLAVLVVAIGRQALRQLREPEAPLGGLVVGIVAGLLFFAMVDYSIAMHRPDQFAGLQTRVDAVYYALATLLTVGYGDISAQGQLARATVSVQMVFNIVVLAGSGSLLARRLADRAERPRKGEAD